VLTLPQSSIYRSRSRKIRARRPAEVADIETMIEELEDIRALGAALAKPERRMIRSS
jgi:hypothetical protein